MKKIPLLLQPDHLDRVASAGPLKAVEELIWNGLDASAGQVEVQVIENDLSGVDEIRIRDNGDGIFYDHIEQLFGDLGGSWKQARKRNKGRSLHGKQGEGRFKAFALGEQVCWKTCYEKEGKKFRYEIRGSTGSMETFEVSDPVLATGAHTGTEVVITFITKPLHGLSLEVAIEELTKSFAAYLTEYQNVSILFRGEDIDPTPFQRNGSTLIIPEIQLGENDVVTAEVSVVEWLIPSKRILYLCDSAGVTLHEVPIGIQAPGFIFTAHLKCDRFRALDHVGDLMLEGLHPDVDKILRAAREQLKNHFRARAAEERAGAVDLWKKEGIYPYQDKQRVDAVEQAERQVFDILAINVQSYLPNFGESDHNSKKFTFLLLAQALKENPESLQRIISEVLNLKAEEQKDLAELLEKTSLSNIISTAQVVTNRLNFLQGLDNLLFDKETKSTFLERDQLHKILEEEAWIFDEDFALSSSEERLEEVLRKHIGHLGKREDGETKVDLGDGKQGRIDMLLNRAITPRTGERDYLVVELKRPSKKIDDEVITQVKKYASAVASDERFNGVPARWKFVAISNEMNDFAKNDANQLGKPKNQVWISPDGNVTVWVREWAEVINTARARLDFINKSLEFEADRESSSKRLHDVYEKFIPNPGKKDEGTTAKENLDSEKKAEL